MKALRTVDGSQDSAQPHASGRHSFGNLFLLSILASVLVASPTSTARAQAQCRDLFSQTRVYTEDLNPKAFARYAQQKLSSVPEFQFIRTAAEERGIRVWLFGGTAASYLHYVKWDVLRKRGLKDLQADRFDYDYTNIFRSTQDLDIVVDAPPDRAKEFEQLLKQRFPHFLGSKENKWEVRSLRNSTGQPGQPGYKEGLLNDLDFSLQNTDSNSVAMVEITNTLGGSRGASEPPVRDLKSWQYLSGQSQFLTDTLKDEITYYRSPRHFETARARLGENPEILSVIRVLVKAFQYEVKLTPESEGQLRQVIQEFNPRDITNPAALKRIKDTSEKLIKHAVNIEYAINKLDELGLRRKLISMGDPNEENTFAWWLNKEPLRTRPVGQGSGLRARDLGIDVVAHETNSFLAYESITRAHSGEPNVLISRDGFKGEAAAHGDGFYTAIGRSGAKGSGLTIRFRLHPDAREGRDADFSRSDDYIIVHNKAALEVIPESLEFHLNDVLAIARGEKKFTIDHSDLALLEKLKRRLNTGQIDRELDRLFPSESFDHTIGFIETTIQIVNSTAADLISSQTRLELVNKTRRRLDRLFEKSDVLELFGEPISKDQISSDLKDLFNPEKKIKIFFGDVKIKRMATNETMQVPDYIFGRLDLASLENAGTIIFPRKVRGSIEFLWLMSAKRLILPEEVDGSLILSSLRSARNVGFPKTVHGDLRMGDLESAKDVEFPKKVGGRVKLDSLKSTEGLILPEEIAGGLYLTSLKSAQGLLLPKKIDGDLNLSYLESAEGLKLPEEIDGTLDLSGLKSARGLVLPKKLKSLDLSYLKSAEGLDLPEEMKGSLILSRLKDARGLILPKRIGGELNLNALESAEGLKLPEEIDRSLLLEELKNARGLIFPKKVGDMLSLASLQSAEGLILPDLIGELYLTSLKSAQGLFLPKKIGRGLDLAGLESADGLKLPEEIGGWLDLGRKLKSAKKLKLPRGVHRYTGPQNIQR